MDTNQEMNHIENEEASQNSVEGEQELQSTQAEQGPDQPVPEASTPDLDDSNKETQPPEDQPDLYQTPQPPTQQVQPPPAPPQQPYYTPRPPKDRSIALILEILPGLFGILGIGWIYAGNTGTGVAILVGFLIWDVIAIVIAILSASVGCFCTVPINIACIAVSSVMLNNYTKQHPELFGQ